MATFFTLLLCLAFPYLALRLYARPGFPAWLSPVVMAYAVGIFCSNFYPPSVDNPLAVRITELSILLALPLLLFSVRLRESWRFTGRGLFAFLLCCASGIICTAVTAWLLRDNQPQGWQIAGMLTGMFTGGTPNMQAIGIAVGAPSEYIILVQAADIIAGGIYLLLLMTVIHRLLGLFLPPFPLEEEAVQHQAGESIRVSGIQLAFPLVLTLLIVSAAVGLTYLLTGGITNSTVLILLLTTLSLLATSAKPVRNWPHSYAQGEYLLLIFCVALGLLADFREVWATGLPLLGFCVLSMTATILLHWLLAFLFRLDRDTVMVSSTAAIYGPVFIAQITSAIHNPRLLAPGIALALLGLAIGNYLGLLVAYTVLTWWF